MIVEEGADRRQSQEGKYPHVRTSRADDRARQETMDFF